MCGPKFCSMKITQEFREYAKNNTEKIDLVDIEEIEKGLKQKSKEFKERGFPRYTGNLIFKRRNYDYTSRG
ncbi:MAG: hypothetical protein CM1200mP12_05010 [Gammaproteobacteria bacterium]|nr:MAG: hypothetical protein CM1200mP12_05010 [Gammaproteobacteria bacterium]